MKRTVHFLILILLFSSCTPSIRLNVLQPAQITIPSHIYKIGLVNRSIAGKSDRVLNVLEGILTGENIGEDREGSDKALISLKDLLDQSQRYEIIIPAMPRSDKAGGLTSDEVHTICKQYGLDALVVLEYFDSNSNLQVVQGKRKEKVKEQIVEVTFFKAEVKLNVNTKWTVYDDRSGAIIDAHDSEDYLSFANEGATPDAAKNGLPQKRSAINQTGRVAGSNYGSRIAPYWITVHREYFKKGSDNLKLASKYSKNGNWEQAINLWKRESSSTDPVIAGRANYNMALACEREGNVELALDYAKRSSNQLINSKASSYVRILEKRLRDQQRLDQQLQHGN
jgi:hypothetical protein